MSIVLTGLAGMLFAVNATFTRLVLDRTGIRTDVAAAATVITKKTISCPSNVPNSRAKATNTKLAELSINSIDINIIIALRRNKTPTTPIENRIAESPR